MIENFGIAIGVCGTAAANDKSSCTDQFAIVHGRATGVTHADTIVLSVSQTENALAHADLNIAVGNREGVQSVPLQMVWDGTSGGKTTPARDDNITIGRNLLSGQRHRLNGVREFQGCLQFQKSQIIKEITVSLVDNDTFHVHQLTTLIIENTSGAHLHLIGRNPEYLKTVICKDM